MSVSDPGEKLSGERIANREKMSECPALMTATYLQYAEGETGAEVFDDGDPLQRGARLPRTPHPTGETMIDRWGQIQCFGSEL
jgi:hypothetical protein